MRPKPPNWPLATALLGRSSGHGPESLSVAVDEVVLDIDDGMKSRCAVNLDHGMTVPRAGVGRRLSALEPTRMAEVCRALAFAIGCERQ
jgi:mRNA-degrading endonuclease toxin of MazEF toxin-antitoxin module